MNTDKAQTVEVREAGLKVAGAGEIFAGLPHASIASLKPRWNSKQRCAAFPRGPLSNLTTSNFVRASGSQSAWRSPDKTAPAGDHSWGADANESWNGHSALARLANGDRWVLKALARLRLFADYERAFTETTGLPVALRSIQSWELAHHGKRNEGRFCVLMAQRNRSCGACLEIQEKLSSSIHICVCGKSPMKSGSSRSVNSIASLEASSASRRPVIGHGCRKGKPKT